VIGPLPDAVALIWGITIGIGGVVIVCVIILLALLRGMLIDLDSRVAEVEAELGDLARNTASAGLLDRAADGIAAMAEELGRHVEALSGKAAP
jgi:hypothetical protein